MANQPNYRLLPTTLLATVALGSSACVVAAAGAGAGSAVYVSERSVESQVPAPVDLASKAVREAFRDLGVTARKYATETDGDRERRVFDGQTPDRDITVTVTTQGRGSVVNVVARHDAVIWDKKLARSVLQKIVEQTK